MLRIAGVVKNSITDGPGFRYSIFTQGCPHNCFGCHNPESHSFTDGEIVEETQIISDILKDQLLDGVTFSGGEPFMQAFELAFIGDEIKKNSNLNIYCFTGYTFEEIYEQLDSRKGWRELLSVVDILIDGRYEVSQKSMNLRFRGSSNQRSIDVKKSLITGIPVVIDI